MSPVISRTSQHYKLEVWPDSCRTQVLNSECELPAVPHDTDVYQATATKLGYGEGPEARLLCCVEHESAHVFLAELMTRRSPVIDHESEFRPAADEDRLFEEHLICAFQQACNRHPSATLATLFRYWLWRLEDPMTVLKGDKAP